MFVLIWVTLLFAGKGGSVERGPVCKNSCITLSEGAVTAEAGLCVVLPCSITQGLDVQRIIWYKSNKQSYKTILDSATNENDSEFTGRVSLLEPDLSKRSCGIIINDLTKSDSGSYDPGVFDSKWRSPTSAAKAKLTVTDLSQKPTVEIPPMTEGQRTTLTCTAPGLCSGSRPEITWMWREVEGTPSLITGNTTDFKTENVTAVTQRHSSTLTFMASAEHHATKVTCKVSFTGGTTTERTEILKVPCYHGPSAVLLLTIAVVSLSLNVMFIICFVFLWNSRRKVNPNQEDRTYMTLQRPDRSPEYDVIGHSLK